MKIIKTEMECSDEEAAKIVCDALEAKGHIVVNKKAIEADIRSIRERKLNENNTST